MRTHLLAAAAFALVSVAAAAPAVAATYPVGTVTPSATFTAMPGGNGTFSGAFNVYNVAAGNFSDTFTFTLPTNGIGSGTASSSTSGALMAGGDLNFTSVLINGMNADLVASGGRFELATVGGVPISAGVLNTVVVSGFSYGGAATYTGNINFTPSAVPEAATWAMMLVGFGMMGAGLRYGRRKSTVAFA